LNPGIAIDDQVIDNDVSVLQAKIRRE